MTKSANELPDSTVATPAAVFPPVPAMDGGCVRIGAQSPLFVAESIVDGGKVRPGAQSPVLHAAIEDAGRVRLGAQTPVF